MTAWVHRYWTGRRPAPYEPWLGKIVRAHHPNARVVDWTDDLLPESVLARLDGADDQVLPRDVPVHRSNIVRRALLLEYGGLYLDNDVVPLDDLTGRSPDPWVTGRPPLWPTLAVMWFPEPGHPALADALALIHGKPHDARGRAPHVSGSYSWPPAAVAIDPSCQPSNSDGTLNPVRSPAAVHLWDTSRFGR